MGWVAAIVAFFLTLLVLKGLGYLAFGFFELIGSVMNAQSKEGKFFDFIKRKQIHYSSKELLEFAKKSQYPMNFSEPTKIEKNIKFRELFLKEIEKDIQRANSIKLLKDEGFILFADFEEILIWFRGNQEMNNMCFGVRINYKYKNKDFWTNLYWGKSPHSPSNRRRFYVDSSGDYHGLKGVGISSANTVNNDEFISFFELFMIKMIRIN
jgi:hypothetical protein